MAHALLLTCLALLLAAPLPAQDKKPDAATMERRAREQAEKQAAEQTRRRPDDGDDIDAAEQRQLEDETAKFVDRLDAALAREIDKLKARRDREKVAKAIEAYTAQRAFYAAWKEKVQTRREVDRFQERCRREKRVGEPARAHLVKLEEAYKTAIGRMRESSGQYQEISGKVLHDPVAAYLNRKRRDDDQ